MPVDLNTLRSVVASAGRNVHTVVLSYIKQADPRRGEFSRREIEPYSYRIKDNVGEVLYGFDYSRMDLRCFALVGIEGIEETQNAFTPRWVVEVAEGAGFEGVPQQLEQPVQEGLTPEQMQAQMQAIQPATPTLQQPPATTQTTTTTQEGLTPEQMRALMEKVQGE